MFNIPKQLEIGDSTFWHDDPFQDGEGNDYTPQTFTLKYALRGPSPQPGLDLTAVADGDRWKTTVSIAQSNALQAGTYYWEAYVVDNPSSPTVKKSVTKGELVVTANISSSTYFDPRSQIEKDLSAVESAISNLAAGNAVQSYTVGTRAIHKMQVADLIKLRAHLKHRLALQKRSESIKNGLGDPLNVYVRFNK